MSERSETGQDQPTVGKLVVEATRDVSALVQREIALAKSELKVSVKAGGVGAALIGVAVFLLLIVVILASVTVAYFIVMAGLDPAWAFLIVTGFYLLLALVLAFVAYTRFKKVRAPQKTIETAKALPSAFKGNRAVSDGK